MFVFSLPRVLEYNLLEKEHPLKTLKDDEIPTEWPQDGRIEFRNIFLRYSPIGTAALNNLSLMIHPREKIGIVGRTGAGKTSIISALFRFVPSIKYRCILLEFIDEVK
jgi:ATP-binding cassette subfamily C (CFTR/MRP) protein 4